MPAASRGLRALLTCGVALGLAACITPPAVPVPLGSATAAPSPLPAPAATPSTSPAAEPAALAVVDGACSEVMIDALTGGLGGERADGFARPELIAGFDPACSGTVQTADNDYSSAFSYAVLPLSDAATSAIDERIPATGLQRGDPVLTYYVDAQQAVMATLYPVLLWQDIEEQGPYDDAEAWLLLRWYVAR